VSHQIARFRHFAEPIPPRRRTASRLAAFSAILALAPAGCAFTEETVRPPQAVDVVTRSNRGGGRTIVVADAFADRRPDRSRCGMKKNGFNSDSAKLVCKGSPDEFLPRLLASELRAAGFRVLSSSGAKLPAADAVISGSIQQYFIEPKVNFFGTVMEADVAVTLAVRLADGRVAERKFFAKGDEPTFVNLLQDGETASAVATRELLASAAGAIANLLDRTAGAR
jgi:hypothetical protein